MEEHLGWLSNLKKKQEGKSPLRAIHGRDPLGEYLQILDGRETYISLGLLAFPGDSWHELEIRDPHCSLGVYDFSICREDGGKFTCCGYAIELRELTPGRPDKQTQTEDLVGIPVLETRKVRFTSVSRVVRWFWKTHPGLSRTKVRVYDAVYDWVPAVKKAWRECVSQLDREGRLGPPLSQKLQVALLLQRLPDVREEKPAHPRVYALPDAESVIDAFWSENPGLPQEKIPDHQGTGLMYPADVRTAFANWFDTQAREGRVDPLLSVTISYGG